MADIWNANDYSNIITVGAAALCSILMVIFKSRCSKIKLCCGAFSCDRKVQEEDGEKKKIVKNKDGNPNDEETGISSAESAPNTPASNRDRVINE
jgi:hypothetical protein|tara:strand:- start:418 stop:702 length:285 start_codon:yes stop_codon:yes gene_type:complete